MEASQTTTESAAPDSPAGGQSPADAQAAAEGDVFAERPEVFVGAAFAGGLALAGLLRWLGRCVRWWARPRRPAQVARPMTPSGDNGADKTLGDIVTDVSEKASLLVREEIELAKSEVTEKAKILARGAGVGVAAGVFLVFAVVMMLNTFAWLINDALDTSVVWPGFAIVTLILIILGAIAGLLAKKWLGAGPPTPDLAIEEAKITRETLEHQNVQRDQLERSTDRAPHETRT